MPWKRPRGSGLISDMEPWSLEAGLSGAAAAFRSELSASVVTEEPATPFWSRLQGSEPDAQTSELHC